MRTGSQYFRARLRKDYLAADSSASSEYDHTHLGPKGADAVASFVRDAIRASPGVPGLAPYLR